MRAPYFCSDLARARQERLYGTAPEVDTWILIEHPEPWGPKAVADSLLPGSVKAWIAALPPTHRALLIRRDYARSLRLRCFIVRSREHESDAWAAELQDYEDLLSIDVMAPRGLTPFGSPLFLICTHGRKDKCCSKFGLPAYHHIQKQLGDAAWQCSHVGGDRFAANILWFPHGIYFGHVATEATDVLLESCARRELLLEHLRGRTCYKRPVQVGEYYIRRHSGLVGLDDLTLVGSEALSPTEWTVQFSARDALYSVTFRVVAGSFQDYLTCAATETRPVTQYELVDYVELSTLTNAR